MGLVLLLERVIRNSRPNHWNFKNLRSSFGREFHPPQVQGPCWFSLLPQRLFCIYTCDARRMKQLLSRVEEEKSSWAPESDTKSLRTVNEPLVQAETSPTSLGVLTCAFILGIRAGRPHWNQRHQASAGLWSPSAAAVRQHGFCHSQVRRKGAPWVGKDERGGAGGCCHSQLSDMVSNTKDTGKCGDYNRTR